MSVASEFPPEVHIPARARRGTTGPRHLTAVPAGSLLADPRRMPPAVGQPVRSPQPVRARQLARLHQAGQLRVEPARLCHDELCHDEVQVSAPLRLTRRGVAAVVLAAVFAAGLLLLVAHLSLGLAPHDATTGSPAGATAANVVVVQNGDTLWTIAQRVSPSSDPRQVVDQLQRANHLKTVDLSPGQTLKLH